MSINCDFKINEFWTPQYTCDSTIIDNRSVENVTELFGTHMHGSTGSDVKWILLKNQNL